MDVCNTIAIHGSPESVYRFAAAVERWPELLPHYRAVVILEAGERERLVAMHCVRAFGPLGWPCRWRARQELRPEICVIYFTHVAGPARGMEVEWCIEAAHEGAQATIRHRVSPDRPWWSDLYWRRVVGPIFVRPIAARTLQTIKQLVEDGESE